jgi:hypothetical protein
MRGTDGLRRTSISPRTWYGMPAYANAEGKIVFSFKKLRQI